MPRTSRNKPVESLGDLKQVLQRESGFHEILASLKNGRAATVDGTWGSAAPLALAALLPHVPGTLLVVVSHVGDVDDFAEDLASFTGIRPEVFPAWDRWTGLEAGNNLAAEGRWSPEDLDEPDEAAAAEKVDEVLGQRQRIIKQLGGAAPPRVVVGAFQAMMQPVPLREAVERSSRGLAVGQSIALEELIAWLLDSGLRRAEVVEVAGEFASRGGIVDVFAPDATEPVRIEFFGDEIESIRSFDAETQRSLERLDSISLSTLPRLDTSDPESLACLSQHLPADSWVALVEPLDLAEQGRIYAGRVTDPRGLFSVEAVFQQLTRHPSVVLAAVAGASLETTWRMQVESVERFAGDLSRVKAELESAAGDERVLIACQNEGEAQRLSEVFADTQLARQERLVYARGRVRSGFHLIEHNLLVIGDHELFARPEPLRASPRRRYESRAIDSFLDLNEGDLVVHVNHGIAYYRGLQLKERGEDDGEEQLVLEFAERSRLFVPIAQIDLVQKYVGGGKHAPALSKLGTSTWEKRKRRVAEAVVDLATDLLEVQAKRACELGFAYSAEDSHWQREFETAFPFQETPDQLSAISGLKEDLASPRPMDRLLCGDVGYGKTEVAMRAAFKVVEGGRQVAVLVPTTVLAEQHYRTFSARMGEFPVNIDVVNRFRPRSEVKEVLNRASAGAIDILIGTHRLVQKDVSFKDLGLVIIDEEQRFGVEDKEWLKSLRATVDLLTLSATPIPRTLHMSLIGLRDISNLETPPPDRKSIETRIGRWDDEQIRRAIHRELNRDGQVFFVHNRVYDIHLIAERLKLLVPDARVLIGHGQMSGDELERAMLGFVRHQADILVATTIIESGVDIPNVNTIFINDADQFGLADLHQLRGRVGRYKHRAYAYLMVDPSKSLTPNAIRRLKAIEEYSDLGAGFKIALRDLEIRGAGNILGAEQSGHIEAVGYELYCSLLESAVKSVKHGPAGEAMDASIELGWRAYLPRDYVPGAKLKIELYRRLSRLRSLEQLADFRRELEDRFGGPLPAPAENLLLENRLRILAGRWRLGRVHLEEHFAVLSYRDSRLIEALARYHPGKVRVADERAAYVPLDRKRPPAKEVADLLLDILDPESRSEPKPATKSSGQPAHSSSPQAGKPRRRSASASSGGGRKAGTGLETRRPPRARARPGELAPPAAKAQITENAIGLGARLKKRERGADSTE